MKFTAIALLLLVGSNAAAESRAVSHFGFGIESNRFYKINGSGGSMMILDWSVPFSEDLDLGLRTMANGAQPPGISLFRLTSGPNLTYHYSDNFQVTAGMGFYRESVEYTDGSKANSDGISQIFGLQRTWKYSEKIHFGWGTYLSLSQGFVKTASVLPQSQHSQIVSGSAYESRNSGIFGSLRVDL